MDREIKRVYVDSSVVLGKFDVDESRRQATELFWHAVQSGEIIAVVSNVLADELASEQAWQFFADLPNTQIERTESTEESNRLATQYIAEKVVSEKSLNDCKHVTIATINHADGIVSWNLHDMVKRETKYNRVNLTQGYPKVKILTPNRYKELYHEIYNIVIGNPSSF